MFPETIIISPKTPKFASMRSMFLFCMIFPMLLTAQPVSTQAPNWKWVNKIDGYYCQSITECRVTGNNEIVVCGVMEDALGATFHGAGGKADSVKPNGGKNRHLGARAFLAKYDTTGKLLWKVVTSGRDDTYPWAMNCDHEGNILIGGNLVGGDTFWGTDGKFFPIRGIADGDHTTSGRAHNYFLVKYDPAGKLMWYKVGLTKGMSHAKQIEFDAKNNAYVLAYCTNNAISFDSYSLLAGPDAPRGYVDNFSLILIKYSSNGSEQWITYGGNTHVALFNVNAEGEVTLFTRAYSAAKIWNTDGYNYKFPAINSLKMFHIFLDHNGHVKNAEEAFPAITNAYIDRYVKDMEGNYYCLVYPNTLEPGMGQIYHPKIGDKIWETRKKDFYLVKCNSSYQPLWTAIFGGSDNDEPISIELDKNQEPYVTGWYWSNTNITDAQGKSIPLYSKIKEMFLAAFTAEGKANWVIPSGKLNILKDYTEFCHMRFNQNNDLVVAATIGHPGDLGQFHVDIKGPLAWQAKPDPRNNLYDFTDAYIAFGNYTHIKKQIHPLDTVKNQLPQNPIAVNQNQPISRDSSALAGIPVAIDSSQFFKPGKPVSDPGTGNQGGGELPSNNITLQVFPNPVSQLGERWINIRIEVKSHTRMQLEIRDQQGKLIESHSEKIESGEYNSRIKLDGYAPGIYYFNFIIDNNSFVKRIVVL